MTRSVTVQIMAGGRSRRMGTDKALVKLDGKTLLERAVEKWKGWGEATFLSVGNEERGTLAPAGIVPVFDRFPSHGPLGGLHGGLVECRSEFLLICPVSDPFLNTDHAERLLCNIGGADACVYEVDGAVNPLFGLYRRTCLDVVYTMLAQGELSLERMLEMVNTVVLPAENSADFRSIDTPEELARAQSDILCD